MAHLDKHLNKTHLQTWQNFQLCNGSSLEFIPDGSRCSIFVDELNTTPQWRFGDCSHLLLSIASLGSRYLLELPSTHIFGQPLAFLANRLRQLSLIKSITIAPYVGLGDLAILWAGIWSPVHLSGNSKRKTMCFGNVTMWPSTIINLPNYQKW